MEDPKVAEYLKNFKSALLTFLKTKGIQPGTPPPQQEEEIKFLRDVIAVYTDEPEFKNFKFRSIVDATNVVIYVKYLENKAPPGHYRDEVEITTEFQQMIVENPQARDSASDTATNTAPGAQKGTKRTADEANLDEETLDPIEKQEKALDKIFSEEEFQIISQFEGTIGKQELDFLKGIDYNGYNPKTTLKRLMVLSGGKDFTEDMHLLCLFYVLRGTRYSRALLRTTEGPAKAKMMELIRKYGIIDLPPRSTVAITLGRIAGCFPMNIAKILESGKERIIGQVPSSTCPIPLQFPGAGALIPALGTIRVSLEPAWKDWATEFAAVIQSESQEAFLQITMDSPYIPEAVRLKFVVNSPAIMEFLADNKVDVSIMVTKQKATTREDINKVFNKVSKLSPAPAPSGPVTAMVIPAPAQPLPPRQQPARTTKRVVRKKYEL